jgi:hypothetical protein
MALRLKIKIDRNTARNTETGAKGKTCKGRERNKIKGERM